jgi:hypothetical protein
MFVAGPVSIKTSAAPGDRPAKRKLAATGVDAVAQMYIGRPTITMMSMAITPSPHCKKNDCGT